MINSRSNTRNPACIAYFGSGRFNMNYYKTLSYAPELLKRIPVYCAVGGNSGLYYRELSVLSGGRVFTPYEAAIEIGESRIRSVTITEQLDDGFSLRTGQSTQATVNVTMGRSTSMTVSAVLRDTSRTGELPVSAGVSVSMGEQTVTAGALSLYRDGYWVNYNRNGGEGTVPVDNTLYGGGTTVALKPASLQREGWNFSGWTHPHIGIQKGTFSITGDTTVNAAWGRAYVKLTSSNTASQSKGNDMMSRSQIEAMESGKAFYDPIYWNYLTSITIESTKDAPVAPGDAVASWDITDTTGQSKPGSVIAWLTEGPPDGMRKTYALTIAGKGGVTAPADCTLLFGYNSYNSTPQSINGLEHLDTSKATNMSKMFQYSCKVSALNVGNWDVSNVTDMSNMFYQCSALSALNVGNWDVSNVTDMSGMFYRCMILGALNIEKWDVSNVADMSSMFYDFGSSYTLFSLDLSGWDTSNVKDMRYMFWQCSYLKTLNVSGWNTGNVEDMREMFYGCNNLTTLNTGELWNTSKVLNMSKMFAGCSKLTSVDVSGWNVSNVRLMISMFQNCSALTALNVSKWVPSYVVSMESMFSGCTKLADLPVDQWTDTGRLCSVISMFDSCKALTSLDLHHWNTVSLREGSSSVKIHGNEWIHYNSGMGGAFNGCSGLTRLNLSGWNTSKISNMSYLFRNCSSLTLNNLNLTGWDTSSVTSMMSMFYNCKKLNWLYLGSWKMSKVTDIRYMFQNCENLTNINISQKEWRLTAGCQYVDWRKGANVAMDDIKLYVGGKDITDSPTGRKPASAASLAAVAVEAPVLVQNPGPAEEPPVPAEPVEETPAPAEPAEETPAPAEPAEETPAPVEPAEETPAPTEPVEETPAPTEPAEENPAPAPDESASVSGPDEVRKLLRNSGGILLDSNKRPVYARDKIGLWDLGRVNPSQQIDYSLQLQYLGENVDQYGGVSGLLTVTNPLPEGLTLVEGSLHIGEKPAWIDISHGGTPEGRVVQEPQVKNGILTFSVTGLSMGAQYSVFYSCTAPAQAPASYIEFLNTASVDDNGLPDQADPVRHYMLPEDETDPPASHQVTYAYDGTAPSGAPVYGKAVYVDGTELTLPRPAAPGYLFNGWKIDGTGGAVTEHTVTGDVTFIGSWTKTEIPKVHIAYDFTTPGPENALLIQEALLADAITEAPENTVTSAPVPDVVPEGWTFVWEYPEKLAVNDGGSFNVGHAADWPGGIIHIRGRWTRKSYTVTYAYLNEPADAPALPAPNPQTYPWGTAVSLAPNPANTATHYFLGWTSAGITLEADGTFAMPKANINITGDWAVKPEPDVHEVKIEPNGGLWKGLDTDSVLPRSEYDQMLAGGLEFPDPVRDGCEFLGWLTTSPDPDGLFDLVVTARWKEPEAPPALYAVTFDAQGRGTAPGTVTGLASGDKVPKPADPSVPGYTFGGWFREAACETPWDFDADTVTENITLYAKWTEGYQISGVVLDPDGNPVAGAEVKIVHEGDRLFQKTETGPDGRYTIDGVPNGIYNTVATYENSGVKVTTTILSVISGQNLNQEIRFATGNTNSVLTAEQMPETTPYVVVGGLEQEAESVRTNAPGAAEVRVSMNVTPADQAQKETEIQAIQKAAEQAAAELSSQTALRSHVDLVLDINLSKTLTAPGGSANMEKITNAANILELVIPYPMEGKTNILVHRFHSAEGDPEGAVTFARLQDLPADPASRRDKTFYLDTVHGLIHVFAGKFSLYAVSYTTESTVTPPVNSTSRARGGGGRTAYLITASAGSGGTIRPAGQVRVSAGADRTFAIVARTGYDVADVLVDGNSVGAVTSYTFQNVRTNHTIEASFTASGSGGLLDTEDHRDYLHGFRDGFFRPDAPMTRGQAAQMFYNLLRDQDVNGRSAFTDVPEEIWCYEAVSALKTLDVMRGVTEERFEPDRPITRAELVVTAVRFTEHQRGNASFTDVAETDWYCPEVSAAAARGWINGYPDGTFRPNNPITRAQTATVINRLLGRLADGDFLEERPAGLRSFPDALPGYWAYEDIMESANAHDYHVQGGRERWTALHRG